MAENYKAGHEPEPWSVKGKKEIETWNGMYLNFITAEGHIAEVALCSYETDARRIVACVNACASISTAALEAGAVRELVEAMETIANKPIGPPEASAEFVLNEIVRIGRTALARIEWRD